MRKGARRTGVRRSRKRNSKDAKKGLFVLAIILILYLYLILAPKQSDTTSTDPTYSDVVSGFTEGFYYSSINTKIVYGYDPQRNVLVQCSSRSDFYYEHAVVGDLDNGLYELISDDNGGVRQTDFCWIKTRVGSSTYVVHMAPDGTYDFNSKYTIDNGNNAQYYLRKTSYYEDHIEDFKKDSTN